MKTRILVLAAVALMASSASAQFTNTYHAPMIGSACPSSPGLAIDFTTGDIAGCGDTHIWSGVGPATAQTITNKTIDTATNTFKTNGSTVSAVVGTLGVYQGTTATAIADGNFKVLTGPAISIPAGSANVAGKHVRVKGAGVYTNAAASLLNVEISLCTVSGCATGTVVSAAGCLVTSTNQANNLTNGQFTFDCDLITATTGAAGTLMAKSDDAFNLGATTAAVLSRFADTATALSAAVDLTVAEFVHPQFKFTTGNAGNSVTLQYMTVQIDG